MYTVNRRAAELGSTVGCRGIVLETLQTGGTRATSREAVARFFQRLTAAAHGGVTEVRSEQAAGRERHNEQVEHELDAAGI